MMMPAFALPGGMDFVIGGWPGKSRACSKCCGGDRGGGVGGKPADEALAARGAPATLAFIARRNKIRTIEKYPK